MTQQATHHTEHTIEKHGVQRSWCLSPQTQSCRQSIGHWGQSCLFLRFICIIFNYMCVCAHKGECSQRIWPELELQGLLGTETWKRVQAPNAEPSLQRLRSSGSQSSSQPAGAWLGHPDFEGDAAAEGHLSPPAQLPELSRHTEDEEYLRGPNQGPQSGWASRSITVSLT